MGELGSVNRWTQHDGTISSRELLRGILMKFTSNILLGDITRCFLRAIIKSLKPFLSTTKIIYCIIGLLKHSRKISRKLSCIA